MTKILKYFMWRYQPHYRFNIKYYAERLFEILSKDLKPYVFLVGVQNEVDKSKHPVCIEPEDCGLDVSLFEDVKSLAKDIHSKDPRKDLIHTQPDHHARCQEDLKISCLRQAVQELVDKSCSGKGKTSFVSYPVLFENYYIFVVIQFDKIVYDKYYALCRSEVKINEIRSASVRRSLIDSVVHNYLNEAVEPLYRPRAGVYHDEVKTDKEELLRISAANFIGSTVSATYQSITSYYLYEICNFISSLKYEGDSSLGKLIICSKNHENIENVISLSKKVHLRDYRKVRKLLEITSDDLHLHCDGEHILGFVRLIGKYDSDKENLFIINFSGHYRWEFVHDGNIMMSVQYNTPRLPFDKIDKYKFDDTFRRIFEDISDDNLNGLWKLIECATKQKKGSLIIVSKNANSEAKRLEQQSTNLEPLVPGEDIIELITSIDGAVLLDPTGKCYSIGVILDGIATSKGSSARGARYNSALRYVEENKGECVAVIISEDGMVDLYPQLMPQIKKNDIESRLIKLREEVGKEDIDYDVFRPIMNWFDDHRFYLYASVCDEINKLRDDFNSKLKMESGALYIQYNDFKPNPEMNDSYFLKE